MKLLINTSNIKNSGALQVTLSFLEEIRQNRIHKFAIILSEAVYSQIEISKFGDNFEFYNISLVLPFKKSFRKYLKSMVKIEKDFSPDCVFSVFSPTYWTPKTIHVTGFAYPWIINPDSEYIKSLPIKKRFLQTLENKFKSFYFKGNSKYFIVETEDVKKRLFKYLRVPLSQIYVVSSTYNHYFGIENNGLRTKIKLNKKNKNEFRVLTVSLNFPHKNLIIIRNICISLLKKNIFDIRFYVTLPESDYQKLFGSFTKYVINIGTFQASSGPSIYNQCDILFMPTLLECFSGTYPEAMISRRPILTSNLDFAHSVCGDAAIYIDPFNPDKIVDAILELKLDKKLYASLVDKGLKRVKGFPRAHQRAKKYLKICEQIAFPSVK